MLMWIFQFQGFFEKTANALPFVHAAELEKALFGGSLELAAAHLPVILLYSAGITVFAVLCFLGQMNFISPFR